MYGPVGPSNSRYFTQIMTDDEFADRVRLMVEHENSMRDQRVNWLIASQGLLISGLGFAWDKDKYLVISIAVVGICFCVSIGANLFCNTLAIRKLAASWKQRCKPNYDGPAITALRSIDIVPKIITKLYPWNVLPFSLSGFWIFAICYRALS